MIRPRLVKGERLASIEFELVLLTDIVTTTTIVHVAGTSLNKARVRSSAFPAEEATLSILKTAEVLGQRVNGLLREFGMTSTQYNVLRILRGAGSSGLACSQVGERMITHDPDITRLLDRMENNGWVVRERSHKDRRVVNARITKEALSLMTSMDRPIETGLNSTLGQLGTPALDTLIDLLEKVRKVVES